MPDGEFGVASVVVAEHVVGVYTQEVGPATVQLLHVVEAPVLDQHRRHRPVTHIRVRVCYLFCISEKVFPRIQYYNSR